MCLYIHGYTQTHPTEQFFDDGDITNNNGNINVANVVFFCCGSVVGGFYIHTVVLYTIHICNTMLPSTIDHQPTKGFAWFCHYQPFEQCISDTIKVQESFSRTFGKT